jgi:hypothetical protein
MGRREQEPGHEADYTQMTFAEWEAQPTEEITLDHCIVTALPTYTRNGKGYTWDCSVHVPPDLFNQERNDMYQVHAGTYAKEAHKKKVRPGDVVMLTGTPYTQEITLQGGETQTINHLTVSAITVLARSQRQTITVFEAEKQKNNASH